MTQNAWNTPTSTANGQLLIGRASGNPVWATLTQGTGSTITNGAGTIQVAFDNATFDAEFISTASASSSADIIFSGLSSSYNNYILFIQCLKPATDIVELYMRTSTDGGSTYDSGASDYTWTTDGGSSSDSQIFLSGTTLTYNLGNATNESYSCYLYIMKPSGTNYTKFYFDFLYYNISGATLGGTGWAMRKSAADIDAIKIYLSSGNIASGNFTLYGVKP